MREDRPVVVFDLDGTLVDSARDLQILVNQLLEDAGRAPLDLPSIAGMIGGGTAALIERAFRASGGDLPPPDLDALVARFVQKYEHNPVRLTRPFPGVPETLGLLRSEGYRLGVCTNKLERLAQILLGELELDRFFDAIVGSDSVGARKPHPASLLETVRRLGSGRSSGVVMVGDSEADEGAARNAGVSVVLVEYGYSGVPPASLVPDALIGEFAALPNALERLSQDVVPGEGRSGTYCPSAVASLLEGGR